MQTDILLEEILHSGIPARVSGQTILVQLASGVIASVSGQPVLISGQVVIVSGQFSGMPVSVSNQPVIVSGQPVGVSGQMLDRTWRLSGLTDSVSISGQVIIISGQFVSISGQPISVSGQTINALISGQFVLISGQSVLVSGQPIAISGQVVIISGQFVNISGQTVAISGQSVGISGQTIVAQFASGVSLPVSISGQPVLISGQTVSIVSGSPVSISGQTVIASGILGIFGNSVVDGGNSTNFPLGAGGTFTGTTTDTSGYSQITIEVFANSPSTPNGLQVQFSTSLPFGPFFDHIHYYTIQQLVGKSIHVPVDAKFYRVVYTNGVGPQGVFRLETILKPIPSQASIQDLDFIPQDTDNALLTHSVIAGRVASGLFNPGIIDIMVNQSGAIIIDGISGQVVNISGQLMGRTWVLSGLTDSVAISGQTIVAQFASGVTIPTSISGQPVQVSGQTILTQFASGVTFPVDISGQTVLTQFASGVTIATSVSGQPVGISGQMTDRTWRLSGLTDSVRISGQVVNISGQIVNISGQAVVVFGLAQGTPIGLQANTAGNLIAAISGQTVLTQFASGVTIATSVSGQPVGISGQMTDRTWRLSGLTDSVRISGQVVNISGQIVNISGQAVVVFGLAQGTPIGLQANTAGNLIAAISGQAVVVSGQIVNTSGQVTNISGQMSGMPMKISLSGNDAAVDALNDALITQDILHRKVHQGLLWQRGVSQSGNSTQPVKFGITSIADVNPHLSWQLKGVLPGSRVTMGQGLIFSGTGTPNVGINLNRTLTANTSTVIYTSTVTAGVYNTIYDEVVNSGINTVGFGTANVFPLQPYEWVLRGAYKYIVQVTSIPSPTFINFFASWYESGA